MNDATVSQHPETEDVTTPVEVDTIEKPKKKRQPTKKQLESLERRKKRKTQLQKERREDSQHTQMLMNSFVEQNTYHRHF